MYTHRHKYGHTHTRLMLLLSTITKLESITNVAVLQSICHEKITNDR